MSIIDKIKNSVTEATGLPFYYDTPQTLNLRLDRATYPCAMLHILQSGAVTDTNGILRERLTVEMLFATTSRLDFDGTDVEANELDGLKRHAFKWLMKMLRSRDLRLVSINGTNRYYATDDAIYSAFGVNVTFDELQGYSKCDADEEPEPEPEPENPDTPEDETQET